MPQSRLERQLEIGAGRIQSRMASADRIVQPRASAADRPVFSKADEDYTTEFLAKLSQRAGIPASDDPDKILAALDLRIYALTSGQSTRQTADAEFEAQVDAWAKWTQTAR